MTDIDIQELAKSIAIAYWRWLLPSPQSGDWNLEWESWANTEESDCWYEVASEVKHFIESKGN